MSLIKAMVSISNKLFGKLYEFLDSKLEWVGVLIQHTELRQNQVSGDQSDYLRWICTDVHDWDQSVDEHFGPRRTTQHVGRMMSHLRARGVAQTAEHLELFLVHLADSLSKEAEWAPNNKHGQQTRLKWQGTGHRNLSTQGAQKIILGAPI